MQMIPAVLDCKDIIAPRAAGLFKCCGKRGPGCNWERLGPEPGDAANENKLVAPGVLLAAEARPLPVAESERGGGAPTHLLSSWAVV